jgi:hypothetical protein
MENITELTMSNNLYQNELLYLLWINASKVNSKKLYEFQIISAFKSEIEFSKSLRKEIINNERIKPCFFKSDE